MLHVLQAHTAQHGGAPHRERTVKEAPAMPQTQHQAHSSGPHQQACVAVPGAWLGTRDSGSRHIQVDSGARPASMDAG